MRFCVFTALSAAAQRSTDLLKALNLHTPFNIIEYFGLIHVWAIARRI
jgi:hypothetical protein